MAESCETCRYSAATDDKVPGALECRRRPPANAGRRVVGDWPKVYPVSWCGEYEARPAEASKPARKPRPTAGDVETRSEQG